jgi:hypothetical protein
VYSQQKIKQVGKTEQAKLQAHTSLHAQLPSRTGIWRPERGQSAAVQPQHQSRHQHLPQSRTEQSNTKSNQSLKHSTNTCTKQAKSAESSNTLSVLLTALQKAASMP